MGHGKFPPVTASMDNLFLIVIAGVILLSNVAQSQIQQGCRVPSHFHGKFFAMGTSSGAQSNAGQEVNTEITARGFSSEQYEDAVCVDMLMLNGTEDGLGRYNAMILFGDANSNCYKCYKFFFRTTNVIQYQQSSCVSATPTAQPTLDTVCSEISDLSEYYTMFQKTLDVINCKTTFEGTYHMTYEVNFGGGGICDSPLSSIVACQEPGSVYVDNQVFNMNFGRCPDVTSSSNQNIKFQCMGSWTDGNGNVYSAVADLGKEIYRQRFRCMLTRYDQQYADNTRRYTLSRWASCTSLKSPYEGDIRLVLKPAVVGSNLPEPGCKFPRNFTGTWFTTGEFDTDVTINQTHIYFKTKLDEFTYKEALFTCQQTRDSRYLVTAITVGRCEVDYVCFDFMPRHHNIIRWRLSRPFRLTPSEMALPNFLEKKFRQACSWNSFTINRDEAATWKYNTFLLNPPAPVDCPVGGRYKFEQIGAIEEKFKTRIRGITERPRHTIDCLDYVSEMKSCDNNPKKLFVDAEYCDTVDHTGRPIGEYDIPDRELNCVGYWMEDMKSYMITYDEEDAVTPFRCWVYERLDWRDVIMSRATRARCGVTQTAYSSTADEGASLHLVLKENERLFDSCPQRYDTGADPYEKELKIYVLEGASAASSSLITLAITLAICLLVLH